ncbi:hypothetical protein J2T02_003000 [Chitinophaga terrae (ex Kim and Jung 2007)]|nr:hypothetical protein [Chitinophaga terrae (ex Kim and Jung 2007)]
MIPEQNDGTIGKSEKVTLLYGLSYFHVFITIK